MTACEHCPYQPRRMNAPSEVAKAAWRDDLPEWVAAFVQEVERTTAGRTAKRFELSPAAVTRILTNQPEPFFDREQLESDVLRQLVLPRRESEARSLLLQLKQRSEAADV